METKKYWERLLLVAVVFLIFFVITFISLYLLSQVFHIDTSVRQGLIILAVVQAIILFIAPSFVSARVVSPHPVKYLGLKTRPTFLAVAGVVFAYLMALPALNQLIFWNENISFPESWAYWGEVFREMEDKARASSGMMLDVTSWQGLVINLLVIGLLTAFAEELFFRGTLQQTVASSGANHTAIWIVALFFSAMHGQIYGFIPRLLLGAWFGYLLYWTKSLYVPFLAHFLNNGVVVVCTWLNARGLAFDFENFGVSQTGFPLSAFVSAVAFTFFIIFFRGFFFEPFKKDANKKMLNYA